MAYVALYRTYRPSDFSNVAGQVHIVQTLKNAIKFNKVSHAYLFSGPRGTGKTSLAKIMAKSLNCLEKDMVEPCNKCHNCQSINKGNFNDVIEIDAASNNGVDEIREIRDKVKYLPTEGTYKVYIIDEVHMLSNQAFNALLKTLEEPPAHVVFILATTEPNKIPQTILSRVQRFDFNAISIDDIYKRLNSVISIENIKIEDEATKLISTICDGGMRDALSLLDQCLSFVGDKPITKDDVLNVSGNISDEIILQILDNCVNHNQEIVLKLIDEIISSGKEISVIISDIINFLKDILMYKASYYFKDFYLTKEFINFNSKIKETLIYSWLDELNNISNNIKYTNQKRVYLSVGLLKMSEKSIQSYDELLSKINYLEQEIRNIKNNTTMTIVQEEVYTPVNVSASVVEETEFIEEVVTDDTYISVDDVLSVLYDSNKKNKEYITNCIKDAYEKNPNNVAMDMLNTGFVGASSQTKAIFVLADEAKCNRLMQKNNYDKIIKYINCINEFICIPTSNWEKISKEYLTQFKNGNKKPKISGINIMVKKYINEDKFKEYKENIIDLFGSDNIKFEEEL